MKEEFHEVFEFEMWNLRLANDYTVNYRVTLFLRSEHTVFLRSIGAVVYHTVGSINFKAVEDITYFRLRFKL